MTVTQNAICRILTNKGKKIVLVFFRLQGFRVRKESVKRLKSLAATLKADSTKSEEEIAETLKRERRKAERELAKFRKMVCFNCR